LHRHTQLVGEAACHVHADAARGAGVTLSKDRIAEIDDGPKLPVRSQSLAQDC